MLNDKAMKLAARMALEKEVDKCWLTFKWDDSNADLAAKINTDRGL